MMEGWQGDWPTKDETRRKYDRDIAIGWWMFVFLVVGTFVEYVLAVAVTGNILLMLGLNLIEAAGIMWFFMHVARVWRRGGHGGEE